MRFPPARKNDFFGWTPPHHCKVPEVKWVNTTIPVIPDGSLDQCLMYENSSISNNTIPCTSGWTFYSEVDHTIIMEWDLVCKYNYLAELTQSVYYGGSIVGMVAFAYIADRYGRQKVLIACSMLVTILGVATSFVTSFLAFIVIRPFLAAAIWGVAGAGSTYVTEMFDSKRRAVVGTGSNFFWSFSYMSLTLIVYFVRDWRHFQLMISLASLLAILCIWVLPESTFWLLANGRVEEAKEIFRKMAIYNGRPIPRKLLNHSIGLGRNGELNSFIGSRLAKMDKSHYDKNPEIHPDQGQFGDLFRNPVLRKHIVIMSFLGFANFMVYYTLVLGIPSLAGDRFLNFFLSGVVEIPAYGAAMIATVRCGRRLPSFGFYVLSGVPLILTTVIPAKTGSGVDLGPLHTTLGLIGKFGISAVFSVVALFGRELFPTKLRASSGGVYGVLGMVGAIIAPFGAYVAKTQPWISNIVMAAMSLIAATLVLLLPETHKTPLAENMADIYAIHARRSRLFRCVKCEPKDISEEKEELA